jgi:hypothetical protein
MQTQTPTVESFATAFADAATAGQNLADAINRIGDALGFLGTLGDIIGAVASPFGMIGQNLGGIGQTLGNIFGDTPAASPKPKAKPKPKPITGFPSGLVRARAMGGPVGAGQSYLVGEQGPELFVPGMGGSIVPGGGINVTLQAGAFLGSSSDAREFARRVYGAIEEESKRRFTVPPTIRRGAAA